jgi:hypothetical protein
LTAEPTEEEVEPYIRPFADFLAELRHGAVHRELSAALHELIASVCETGKSGSVSLVIKASKHKGTGMLCIDDAVVTKTPALERDTSLWFVTEDGNPSRENPRQLAFEGIHVVTTPLGKAAQS